MKRSYFAQSLTGLGLIAAVITSLSLPLQAVEAKEFSSLASKTAKGHIELVQDRHMSATIRPYRQDELGNRHPLVLVHGIGGTDGSKYFEWDEFLEYLDKNDTLEKRYKIYLFHYDSYNSVADLSRSLQLRLAELLKATGEEKQLRILAYSEGGLLTRNAMQDPWLNERTDKVITIATPFHGSPLASKAWFINQVEQDPLLSPVRLSHRFAYWIAGKKHPSFENDFRWDNFDHAMDVQFLPSKTNMLKTGYALEQKQNFITYGSYFGTTEQLNKQLTGELGVSITVPKAKTHLKHLFTRNILFTYVNKTIAKLPPLAKSFMRRTAEQDAQQAAINHIVTRNIHQNTATQENITMLALGSETGIGLPADITRDAGSSPDFSTEQSTDQVLHPIVHNASEQTVLSMMPFNDGISPISSSLWLGRFTPQFQSESDPLKRLWVALSSLKGKQVARLFPGMDHRNWMDGETRMASDKIPDLLNPGEKPKTVFEWIVHDLES